MSASWMVAVLATAAALFGAVDASASWRVTPVPGSSDALLKGVAVTPSGQHVLLVERERSRRRSLEVLTGARSRVLATGRASFTSAIAADDRGRVVVAWNTQLDAGPGAVRVWERGRIRRLSADGRGARVVSLAVAGDGSGVLLVDDGSRLLVARRGRGEAFGPLRRLALAGPGSAAAARGGRVAIIGYAAGGAPAVQRVLSRSAALSQPRLLPWTPFGRRGEIESTQGLVVAIAADGALLAAFNAVRTGFDPLRDDAAFLAGSKIWAFAWRVGVAAPDRVRPTKRRRTASDPAVLALDDGRLLLSWTQPTALGTLHRSVAVATLGDAMLLVPRLTTLGLPRLLTTWPPLGAPQIVAEGVGAARVYPDPGGGRGARTWSVRVAASGAPGPVSLVAGRGFAGPPIPAVGSATPLVGLNVAVGSSPVGRRVALAAP